MQMFRCALRRSPSSSLADDCITAMAEGVSAGIYNRFLVCLWGNGHAAYLSEAESNVDSEWDSFSDLIVQMCRNYKVIPDKLVSCAPNSSWDFLLNSKYHRNYARLNPITGVSSGTSVDLEELVSCRSYVDDTENPENSFYSELLMESLESLHALYESLKLDTLRKR